MTDTTQPLLVYDRIEANKRQTRGLLALVPVVFLPLIAVIGLLVSLTPAFSLIAFLPVMAYGFLMAIASEMKINLPIPTMTPRILTAGYVAGPLFIAALALVFMTRFLISRYGASTLLRLADATPLGPHDEPELVHVVEHLCIGAGLPAPSIYVTNSRAPNAFATGTSPHRAAVVVTRGLLNLLNRRELEGVIAHELSHIGNDDIRLTTTLAALVGVATIPLTIVRFYFLSVISDITPLELNADQRQASSKIGLGFCLAALFFVGIFGMEGLAAWVHGGWFGVGTLRQSDAVWLWGLSVTRAPVYVFLFAPVLALLIRQAVLQEREFLADADAVRLTQDPEGLALALVKIGAAGNKTLVVDEGSVHLYFADPLDTSLLHAFFPSHPPLASRIALLAQMGSGIPASALRAARQAGARLNHDQLTEIQTAPPRTDQPPPPRRESDHDGGIERALTPVYEQADGWSRVVAWIPQTAAITPVGSEGRFIRVVTTDNVTGYVAASASLSGLAPVRR